MEDRVRQLCEQSIMQGSVFEPDPRWHFLFLENPDILHSLTEFFPEGKRPEGVRDILAAFAERSSVSAACDACAALSRVKQTMQEARVDCRFSESFTLFFSKRDISQLKEAFGIPADYLCAGVLVFTGNPPEETIHPLSWDVFSYMM